MKHTKHKLLSSIATLFVCLAMFIGSTYAWFTDSASTGVNTIQAGNLDIVLEYYDSSNSTWTKVTDQTKLFDDSALWEPGHTEVAYLHIKNAGTLDLKYKMNVNIPSETGSINQKGETFKLSDHLVFGKIPMASADSFYSNDAPGRADARSAAGTTKGLSSWTKAGNLYANPIPATAPSDYVNEEYVALVIYMPETVGNEANHKDDVEPPKIELGVNVVATQLDSESDSFGNDYDANADGNPDNGAAWTMAAFRKEATVPNNVSAAGMTITKYENDDPSAAKLASVTIPSTDTLTATDKVVVSIKPESVPASVTANLTSDQVAFNYDIKLKKVNSSNVESDIASTDLPVEVELNVGKGLSGVKIFHTSEGTTTEVNGVSYNSTTGIATFTTTSFSDYTVVYNAKLTSTLPANAKIVMNLDELEGALENLHDGDYIAFGANIVQDKVDTTSGQVSYALADNSTENVEITIDLNGYVFDGQWGGFFGVPNLTVNILGVEKSVAEYYKHETGNHMVKACAIFNGEKLYNNPIDGYQTTVLKTGLFESNNLTVMAYGGKVIIDGAEIANTADGGAIYTCNSPIVEILSGKLSCEQDGALFVLEPYRANEGPSIGIKGGEFDASKAACMLFVSGEKESKLGSVVIEGGNFVMNTGSEDNVFIQSDNDVINKNRLQIKGGTFNIDPSNYVVSGFHATESNGVWTVVAD